MLSIDSTKEELENRINEYIKKNYGYNVHFVYSYGGSYKEDTSITIRILFKINEITFMFSKLIHYFKIKTEDDYDEAIKYVLNKFINEINKDNTDYIVEWLSDNDIIYKTLIPAIDYNDLCDKFLYGSKYDKKIDILSITEKYD